ncbi:hypothetical protein [Enterococcus avium]|uniref:hypothetical protein n=1 Tax=Enterococcus avium TaxID=33945 RepID=UPI001C1112E3|nr:hypothetical protein [Enterococcus avium]MBU5369491.1 hypothetical protein [Enterococcus avium]
MSKRIWKYERIGGFYYGEVEDGVEVMAPLTDVPPLEGTRIDGEPLTIDDQIYDPYDRKWVEIINALDRNKLNNLDSLYPILEGKNEALEGKANNLAQINSKTMLASLQNSKDIALIKSQLENSEGGNENV